MMRNWCHCLFFIIILTIVGGCATYYDKHEKINSYLSSGNYQSANDILESEKKEIKGNNRVLYYFNKGVTTFMLGDYQTSNTFFQQADLYIEDYVNTVGYQALALVSNPAVKPYKPEDFESVMIHYYMALNYLFMNNYEDAIVECKRLNIQLQRINDKYKDSKNRYSQDAFALDLMGMIYEASGDYNNAFIAYRNAIDTYDSVYQPLIGLSAPLELKKAVIRSAQMTGFQSDAQLFANKYNLPIPNDSTDNGTMVLFWMNGSGPIKAEWSINFFNAGYNDGWITFANDEYGFSFPIYVGNKSSNEQAAFKDLSFLRIAFPKYESRLPAYSGASVMVNDSVYPLEMAQNIDKLAFQCLHDRMLRETTTAIARAATKKALEAMAREQNENIGTILGIINAVTEKADTRNWQSLPYSISYSRISLPAGHHRLAIVAQGDTQKTDSLEVDIEKGKTKFVIFHQH